jgi:Rrf2 family protein
MRLTKSTSHAIRILMQCAQVDGELVKAEQLSIMLKLSPGNVSKITSVLGRASFLEATRGPTGGFRLSRPAHAISIGEVLRAMEVDRIAIDERTGGKSSDRTVNRLLDTAHRAFVQVLDNHTIADVAGRLQSHSRSPRM